MANQWGSIVDAGGSESRLYALLRRFLLQAGVIGLLDLVVLPVNDRFRPQFLNVLAVFALALGVGDLVGDFRTCLFEWLGGRLLQILDLDDLVAARGAKRGS